MDTKRKTVGVVGKAVALVTCLLLLASAAPAQASTATKTYEYGYATPTEAAATAGARSCRHWVKYLDKNGILQKNKGEWVSTYHTSHAKAYGPIYNYWAEGVGNFVK